MKHISFRLANKLSLLALTFSALLSSQSYADDIKVNALIREKGELVEKSVTLSDLTSADSFQGKYFTIVEGETDKPISFNAEASQKLRAATVYYAYTQSREYFKKILAPVVKDLPRDQRDYLDKPMVIRLGMERPYSSAVHFNKTETIYNGAVTVPASDEMRADDVKEWGVETWFFTAKKIKVKNPAASIPNVLNNSAFKLSVFESLAQQDANAAIQQALMSNFSAQVLAQDLIISFGLSHLLLPAIATAVKIIPGYIYLDAAMIPEISANEYAHYALFPWLGLQRRFHVGEGYAHYFAGKIMGLTRLQGKAGKYSKGYSALRGDSKNMYSFMNEVGIYAAMSSFTYSVLEDIEKSLGNDGVSTIVGTLPYLNSDSNLNLDFTRSLFMSLDDLKDNERELNDNFISMQTVLAKRGF